MGAVNTTYTFTATDTITSTKMNDIIDQTTFTNDAVFDTTLAVASGKLKVNAQGITSNEMAASSVIQAKMGANVAGTGPCFSASTSTGDLTLVANNQDTRILLPIEQFDTNNSFSSSRFSPSVAGYYLITGFVYSGASAILSLEAKIYRSGVQANTGVLVAANTYSSNISGIEYLNGSTDYIDLVAKHLAGSSVYIGGRMTGVLVRAA